MRKLAFALLEYVHPPSQALTSPQHIKDLDEFDEDLLDVIRVLKHDSDEGAYITKNCADQPGLSLDGLVRDIFTSQIDIGWFSIL